MITVIILLLLLSLYNSLILLDLKFVINVYLFTNTINMS